ncbi:helix-turn-helix transcriptional regulator [Frankia sp. CcI49]|uniref:helix-turn-helix transcriptional regulator n=1 Tax=Frankia sp. CcI49 TaxID=1745382 RepID=UPI000A04BC83|nr:helix-turn-helix transcriptional regulator [Frankia sp. CcI49]
MLISVSQPDLEWSTPLGGELRARREAAGLSLQGLAVRSGYSRSYLSRVETSRRAATPAVTRTYTELVPTGPTPTPRHSPQSPPGRAAGPELDVTWFGSEVRRLRMATGKSLTTLGSEVYLSRSHLSKIEQGDRRASYPLARSLDTALAAQGRLTRLYLEECTRAVPVAPDTDILARSGRDRVEAGDPDPAERAAAAAERLETLRIRSHQVGPYSVLPDLGAGVINLHAAAGDGRGAASPVWAVLLRYAELLGWTAQETGHDATALRWTRTVADWARALGDTDALGYALIRQSQVARRRGDAEAAVGLARRAGALPGISPRVMLFATQREAQACALARDDAAFRQALDRYYALVDLPSPDAAALDPATRWGPAPDPLFERSQLFEATCLVDLADFRTAAALFDRGMATLGPLRSGYARLAVRQAIAYAHLGEPDHASDVMRGALPTLARQGSASLRGDLRLLIRALNRHRRCSAVVALLPDLTSVARSAGGVAPSSHRPSGAPTLKEK